LATQSVPTPRPRVNKTIQTRAGTFIALFVTHNACAKMNLV
jgi:hypothetical protein